MKTSVLRLLSGPTLAIVLAPALLVACRDDEDDDCFEHVATGRFLLPPSPPGGPDAGRIPAVVTVNGDDAGPDVSARDDAAGGDGGAGVDAAVDVDAAASSDAATSTDASTPDAPASDAAVGDAGGVSDAGAPVDAGGARPRDAGDAGASREWSQMTCVEICTMALGTDYQIIACKAPYVGADGKLYAHCQGISRGCSERAAPD